MSRDLPKSIIEVFRKMRHAAVVDAFPGSLTSSSMRFATRPAPCRRTGDLLNLTPARRLTDRFGNYAMVSIAAGTGHPAPGQPPIRQLGYGAVHLVRSYWLRLRKVRRQRSTTWWRKTDTIQVWKNIGSLHRSFA
jgi:hypothetical protein